MKSTFISKPYKKYSELQRLLIARRLKNDYSQISLLVHEVEQQNTLYLFRLEICCLTKFASF